MSSLGVVLEQDRGSLPFALVHGEPLVACAAWALGEAGVMLVDIGTPWSSLVASGEPVVLHDALCPLTPPAFLAGCVAAAAGGEVVVAVRPVTDTVKEYDGEQVGATHDREELMSVTSPIVLPATVVAALDELATDDLPDFVDQLAQRFPVRYLPAPPLGQRIVDEDDLEVLGALSSTE